MKVILLKDVAKVGHKHDVKNVSDGYAHNFLIPNRLAVVATSGAIQKIEKEKKQEVVNKEVHNQLIEKIFSDLKGKEFSLQEKANDKGHLFAKIHTEEIINLLKGQGVIIDPTWIVEREPIKEIGEHQIDLKSDDFESKFILKVEAK